MRPAKKVNSFDSIIRCIERTHPDLIEINHTYQISTYPLVKLVLGKGNPRRALISAGIHGDEPAGIETILSFLENKHYSSYIKNWEITLLPCINPYVVSKAIGVPLAKVAARVMAGKSLKEIGFVKEVKFSHIAVKESVFPFNKFTDVDVLLGPEMKSTGEVMGIDKSFGRAFAKSQLATGIKLPLTGTAFISVKDSDKPKTLQIAQGLQELGYRILATSGTAEYFNKNDIVVESINKVKEGSPHCVEGIESGEINLVINTVFGEQAIKDSFSLRRGSLNQNLPYCTTISGASALLGALKALIEEDLTITTIQEYNQL